MKKKTSKEAVITLMKDAQRFKRVCHWRKTTVEFYSDYCDAEYRISDTLRSIPEHNADEWRMFANNDEIVLVLTYYYDDES